MRASFLALVALFGCIPGWTAEPPKFNVVDESHRVVLIFPMDSKEYTTRKDGVVHLKAEYIKVNEYSLVEPLNTDYFKLLQVSVPVTERLRAATYEGQAIYCTENDGVFNKSNPSLKAAACFVAEGDFLVKVMPAPGKVQSAMTLKQPVKVITGQC